MAQERTRTEIMELIASWESDPCWDLEDTEGFEAHYEELKAHRLEAEAEWKAWHARKVAAFAAEIGIPDNLTLARYILSLKDRIVELEAERSRRFYQEA